MGGHDTSVVEKAPAKKPPIETIIILICPFIIIPFRRRTMKSAERFRAVAGLIRYHVFDFLLRYRFAIVPDKLFCHLTCFYPDTTIRRLSSPRRCDDLERYYRNGFRHLLSDAYLEKHNTIYFPKSPMLR